MNCSHSIFSADKVLPDSQKQELSWKMKEATLQASSAIGHIIKLGPKIFGIMDEMIDYVSNCIEGSPLRVIKGYALVLAESKMVNEKITISYIVKFIAVM